jgi:hypothetical protein
MGSRYVGPVERNHREIPRGRYPLPRYVLRLTELGPLSQSPGTIIYNRKKDQESSIGKLTSELVQPNPWYKDVVLDV